MSSAGTSWPTGAVLGLSLAAGVAIAGLWLARGHGPASSSRYALSPQECTTECQSRQTDCILDCEGRVPCERQCTEVGRACVERCRRPDAGGGPPGPGGSGGRRGAR